MTVKHRLVPLVAFAAVLSTALGCGARNPLDRQAVSGRVTLDGSPLDHGIVEFSPRQPRGVTSGALIQDGGYTIDSSHGLPPGKYLVRLFSATRSAEPPADGPPGPPPPGRKPGEPAKERIPPRYNVQSDLVVEVAARGANAFDFDVHTR